VHWTGDSDTQTGQSERTPVSLYTPSRAGATRLRLLTGCYTHAHISALHRSRTPYAIVTHRHRPFSTQRAHSCTSCVRPCAAVRVARAAGRRVLAFASPCPVSAARRAWALSSIASASCAPATQSAVITRVPLKNKPSITELETRTASARAAATRASPPASTPSHACGFALPFAYPPPHALAHSCTSGCALCTRARAQRPRIAWAARGGRTTPLRQSGPWPRSSTWCRPTWR